MLAFSGIQGRAAGTENHPGGYAVDIYLQDPSTGQYLANYGHPVGGVPASQITGTWQSTFPAYEQFAQTARVAQQKLYPELDNTFRWGGYFYPGKGNSVPDLMHFDVTPKMRGAMGGGTWQAGATKGFASTFRVQTNGGLSNPSVRSSLESSLAGHPVPPADIPNVPLPRPRPDAASPRSGFGAGDELAFDPVTRNDFGVSYDRAQPSFPDVEMDGQGTPHLPAPANSSGSPDDRNVDSLSAALAWLSGGRNDPAAVAPTVAAQPQPADGLSGALAWLAGGRTSGMVPPKLAPASGSSALTQDQRNAMLAIPAAAVPLPRSDPRLDPVTPMPARAAPQVEQSAPAVQYTTINGKTVPVGQSFTIGGVPYKVGIDPKTGQGVLNKGQSLKLGTGTIAEGIGTQQLQAGIDAATAAAPGALASAGNSIGNLFGNLFGGGKPVPPMDVPINTSANVPQTPGPAGGAYSAPYTPGILNEKLDPSGRTNTTQTGYGGYLPGGVTYPNRGGDPLDPSSNDHTSPNMRAILNMVEDSRFNVPQTSGPAGQSATRSSMNENNNSGWDALVRASSTPVLADTSVTPKGYNQVTNDQRTAMAALPPQYVEKTVQKPISVLNPDYTAWEQAQAASPFTNPGVQGLSPDDRDSPDGIARAVPGLTSPVFSKPAPPRYVTKMAPVTIRQALVARPAAPPAPIATPSIAAALTKVQQLQLADPSLSPSQAYNLAASKAASQAANPNGAVYAAITGNSGSGQIRGGAIA